MVSLNKNIIKQAYAFIEAQEYFLNLINKETLLQLYTELDYVYELLESLDIVSRYNEFEILKDFEVVRVYDEFFIEIGSKSKKINIDCIIVEVHKMFCNV